MRETLIFVASSPLLVRITPAYAGNTFLLSLFYLGGEDHPRVCGKHETVNFQILLTKGSPPRMRETRNGKLSNFANQGITPAYAGNTAYSL